MRSLVVLLVLGSVAIPAAALASPESQWALSGSAGVSAGDQTDPSFSWRFSGLYWKTPGAGIGLQFGRLRWEGESNAYPIPLGEADNSAQFQGLAKGSHELFDLSGSLRIRGGTENGLGGGAPFFELGAGGYRQRMREGTWPPGFEDPRDGKTHVGWHVAFGGMGVRGIAPGAEFRFDWVNTSPGPSTYFTVSAALHVNR